ncbi:MAG: hypothetical protein OXD29_09955, partial [Roseovarius sp.]|nr:hypothetical protein [Roseovarius sp.]MCY4315202.1 hypothetical protein [Roseovarius sp.]
NVHSIPTHTLGIQRYIYDYSSNTRCHDCLRGWQRMELGNLFPALLRGLRFIARHGQWCLILGLLLGLLLPALAKFLKPHLPVVIAALLFVSAFRIGPQAAFGGMKGMGTTVVIVLIYQIGAPLTAIFICEQLDVISTLPALALILVLSAPSITGSPNIAALMGHNPSAAFRLVLAGTAMFPLTVMPVLLFLPVVGTASGVLESAFKLTLLVFGVAGVAFLLRHAVGRKLAPERIQQIDGISAILLGIAVIGMMSEAGPLMLGSPKIFLAWLAFAFLVNVVAQILAWAGPGRMVASRDRAGVGIVAGSRNIALYLIALPGSITDTLLAFIGCYQFPMFMTPLLMRWLYRRRP